MKIGFLAIYKTEVFFSAWKELFFLLTNVGLISFKTEGVRKTNIEISFFFRKSNLLILFRF